MSITDLLLILSIVLLVWLWIDSVNVRELAIKQAQKYCSSSEVMLLDETVSLSSISLKKDKSGRSRICRLYEFEFCSDGAHRYRGKISMLGHYLSDIQMDAYRIEQE